MHIQAFAYILLFRGWKACSLCCSSTLLVARSRRNRYILAAQPMASVGYLGTARLRVCDVTQNRGAEMSRHFSQAPFAVMRERHRVCAGRRMPLRAYESASRPAKHWPWGYESAIPILSHNSMLRKAARCLDQCSVASTARADVPITCSIPDYIRSQGATCRPVYR